MSSAPAKSAWGCQTRVPRSIHLINVVPYNLDSNLYLECVLSTSNAINEWSEGDGAVGERVVSILEHVEWRINDGGFSFADCFCASINELEIESR